MSLIAIFSDVHGNLPALKTVLDDINKRKPDQVYCLGDLVDFAPWTNEVIDLIRALHIPCLMGNHDERIAFDKEVVPLAKHSLEETIARIAAIDHTRKNISHSNKMYLREMPRQITVNFKVKDKDFNIKMVHASTRSNSEYIYEDHDLGVLHEMMNQHSINILISGHTHLPYVRKLPPDHNEAQKYVMNCGAVSRCRETRKLATYLLINIDNENVYAEIIRLPYPVEETIKGILESDIPDFYADFFKL